MPSQYFQRFQDSFLGDPFDAWHDGLDKEALLMLEGEEREDAERLLLQMLASDSDSRAAVGLGLLKSKKAEAMLKENLSATAGSTRVAVAQALWSIVGHKPSAAVLIDTLRNHSFFGARIDAARALKAVKTRKSKEALLDALNDEDLVVRATAADSLLEMHGIDNPIPYFHPLSERALAIDGVERAKGIVELKKAIGWKG
jgi:HEAT repeat protein